MLGATPHHPMVRWGFRNEYLMNRRDAAALERLVAVGFARAGQPLLQLQYFHATDVGCRVVGLDAKKSRTAVSLIAIATLRLASHTSNSNYRCATNDRSGVERSLRDSGEAGNRS
jgi:hypothetical protein